MELANVMLALGGDAGNTIQKFGVTPAEVAVLQLTHGHDAVFDIEVLEETVDRNSRTERARLSEAYGVQDGEKYEAKAVNALFPGAAARLFETFDEMEIDEALFKAVAVKRTEKKAAPKEAAPKKTTSKKGATKAEAGELAEAGVVDDGIDDMPDVMG